MHAHALTYIYVCVDKWWGCDSSEICTKVNIPFQIKIFLVNCLQLKNIIVKNENNKNCIYMKDSEMLC